MMKRVVNKAPPLRRQRRKHLLCELCCEHFAVSKSDCAAHDATMLVTLRGALYVSQWCSTTIAPLQIHKASILDYQIVQVQGFLLLSWVFAVGMERGIVHGGRCLTQSFQCSSPTHEQLQMPANYSVVYTL